MRKLLAVTVILVIGAAMGGCCSTGGCAGGYACGAGCGITVSPYEDPGVAPPSHACTGCCRPKDIGPAPESVPGCWKLPADLGPAPKVCVQKPCPLLLPPACDGCCHPACWPF